MTLVNKTQLSGGKALSFFAECDSDDTMLQLDVDALVHEDSFTATITLDRAAGPGDITLEISEQGIDDLRAVLYEVSKQLMFNRNKRALREGHGNAFLKAQGLELV